MHYGNVYLPAMQITALAASRNQSDGSLVKHINFIANPMFETQLYALI
jgi:hypothetical protein